MTMMAVLHHMVTVVVGASSGSRITGAWTKIERPPQSINQSSNQ